MIKITVVFTALFIGNTLVAQEDTLRGKPYNRWSIEINAGQNKAIKPFTDGYYSSNPDKFLYFSGVNHFDAGVRYMLSDRFGLKLSGAYDLIENQKESGSLPFSTKSYRVGLEGIANIGHLLNFKSFTHRLGLLAHAGVQVSRFEVENQHERNGGVMLGLTPQLRLTRWCALTGDFTYIGNVRQHLTWDGQYSPRENNLSGAMVHTSLGLTFYLGKKETHADWYDQAESNTQIAQLETASRENKKRLDDFETMLQDTDKDGVPDYLDRENNTPNGVAVDSKGRYIDNNNNGVPDELEPRHGKDGKDSTGNHTGKKESVENIDPVAILLKNGSYNVFYDINKDTPDSGSTANIYELIRYMKQNNQYKIRLTGYADATGNEKQNKDLAVRRAQNLKKIFITAGINENRIEDTGAGPDSSFPKSVIGLRLARRVSVELIHD